MGKQEVYQLLKKHPGLTTREIAERLNISVVLASRIVNRLIKDNDLISVTPSPRDLERIFLKYPNSVRKSPNSLKIFFIIK